MVNNLSLTFMVLSLILSLVLHIRGVVIARARKDKAYNYPDIIISFSYAIYKKQKIYLLWISYNMSCYS